LRGERDETSRGEGFSYPKAGRILYKCFKLEEISTFNEEKVKEACG
jgi:hypothetical protein